MEEMKPEQLIFHNQVRVPVVEYGHKLIYETVDVQYVLPVRCV